MREVLLDANMLMAVFDEGGSTSQVKRDAAKQKMAELLSDEQVRVVITPLIRYEALRGIGWQHSERYQQLKQALDSIQELDVNREISELAANLFRFDWFKNPDSNRNIDKRRFDVFHLASAKCHDLEVVSQDSDLPKPENLYQDYLNAERA